MTVDYDVVKRGEKGVIARSRGELLNLRYIYMWSKNYKPLTITDSAYAKFSDEQKSVVEEMRLEQLGKSGHRIDRVIPFPNFIPIQMSTTIEDNALHTVSVQRGGRMVDEVRDDVVAALRKAYKGFIPADEFDKYTRECFELERKVCDRQRDDFVGNANREIPDRPTIQATARKSKRWTDLELIEAADILYRHYGPSEGGTFVPPEIPKEDMAAYEAEIKAAQKEQNVEPEEKVDVGKINNIAKYNELRRRQKADETSTDKK